ncbi:hypothetical protein LEM8419_00790 [Neolewinella maritima]|uniref:DUF4249 family protein n=1 Tax=Neolewinella maritima TaxID=1383882 RepID=A0ABM9AXQ0_9BACT|nr:DUF4249 family protein [Neolewinella maritima]CAH0999490.1 hypothetical protein LEM8419_00790 [Neolewinella maritima]
MRYLTLLLALGMMGCTEFFIQEIADAEVPFIPQLAVFTLLQPQDSLIVVDVRLTAPAVGSPPPDRSGRDLVSGAQVTISDSLQTFPLTLSTDPLRAGYVISNDIVRLRAGGRYTVSVTYEDLTARGTVTIPPEHGVGEGLEIATTEEGQNGFAEHRAWVSLLNPSGEEDYYLLLHDRRSYRSDGTLGRPERSLVDWLHGRTVTGPRLHFLPLTLAGRSQHLLRICRTTAATVSYLSSRDMARANTGNPFAEPTQVSSNVEGGLGLVGCAQCRLVYVKP